MEELKTLFGEGSLSYDEFTAKCLEQNIKLANLGSGLYVDKAKLTNDHEMRRILSSISILA